MPQISVPFSGFAFGEYGSQASYLAGFAVYRAHLLYKGWWTGQNIMRGIDGSLFPRGGERPYILTGVPNGPIQGIGATSSGGHPYVWFVVGGTVYRFRADLWFESQAVDTYTGSITVGTEPLSWVDHSGVTYVFAYPNGQYKLDHGAKTVAAIAGSPAGLNCTIYGSRLVAGSANTLYYTGLDPDGLIPDFENWGMGGEIQIGDVYNILSVDTVGGRLAIGKDGILGQPWFVLSGVPGFNHVLRQTEVSLTPPHNEASVDMGQGVGLVTGTEGNLAVFDGARLHVTPYLLAVTVPSERIPSEVTAFRLRRPGDWGVVTDRTVDAHDSTAGSIWLFRNGAWSRHRRAVPAGVVSGAYSVSLGDQSLLAFGQGGDSSHPATFCSFNPYLDRPPFTSDAGSIIDPASCFFALPEWWTRDENQVAVDTVVVDLLSWQTGSSDPNTFDCTSVAMRIYDPDGVYNDAGGDIEVPANRTYSESPAAMATTGTRRRVTFKYPPTWGNGFRLLFTNLRGVSIQKVTVVAETRPSQGV